MKNRIADISQRKAAMVAGFGLLLMTVFALFADFFVLPGLIVPGDATETANNIMAAEGLFRMAICSFLIVIILDVLVAWALLCFTQTGKQESLVAYGVVQAGVCRNFSIQSGFSCYCFATFKWG